MLLSCRRHAAHTDEFVDIHINIVVLDLTRERGDDIELGAEETAYLPRQVFHAACDYIMT